VFLTVIGGGAALEGSAWLFPYLMLAGPLTAMPLLLFAMGARRLMLSTVGALQFIGPTLQFSIGLATGEPFSLLSLLAFVFIWTGFGIYVWDARKRDRAARRAQALAALEVKPAL
jgi:chloramphenicol-sensitive protein RarD